MVDSNFQILYSKDRIQERVEALAGEISDYYQHCNEPVVAVCVLKGAFIFFADLFRKLRVQPEIDFVRLASYGEKTYRDEKVVCEKDLEVSIKGKHVLVVEDIVDTGCTIDYFTRHLRERGPISVKVCALVHKRERSEIDVALNFSGFYLERGFVVGYGLDYAEKYRHLEDIWTMPE